MNERIMLRVAEAHHRDAGRDIARIDRDIMEQMDILSGDIILVVGKEKACAIAGPGYPEDEGTEIIRIDGNIRSNARVGIDDKIYIQKSTHQVATRVVLAPTQKIRLVKIMFYAELQDLFATRVRNVKRRSAMRGNKP